MEFAIYGTFFRIVKRTYFQAVQKKVLGASAFKALLSPTAALHPIFSLKSSGQLTHF
jgi:hypothetical protein